MLRAIFKFRHYKKKDMMLGWKNKVIHGFCLLTFLSYILYFFNISDIFHLWSSSHSLCVAQAAVGGRARKPFYCKSSREAASKIQVVFFHKFCKNFHQMHIFKGGCEREPSCLLSQIEFCDFSSSANFKGNCRWQQEVLFPSKGGSTYKSSH